MYGWMEDGDNQAKPTASYQDIYNPFIFKAMGFPRVSLPDFGSFIAY